MSSFATASALWKEFPVNAVSSVSECRRISNDFIFVLVLLLSECHIVSMNDEDWMDAMRWKGPASDVIRLCITPHSELIPNLFKACRTVIKYINFGWSNSSRPFTEPEHFLPLFTTSSWSTHGKQYGTRKESAFVAWNHYLFRRAASPRRSKGSTALLYICPLEGPKRYNIYL